MPILGNVLKRAVQLGGVLQRLPASPARQQRLVLRKLLRTAAQTAIGQRFNFDGIADQTQPELEFARKVPIYDYNSIHHDWWHLTLEGREDVTWPGKVRYFALSSGTSEASSKYIPVTREMIRAIRKASYKQIFTLAHFNLPSNLFEKGILMLGGSTHLNFNGTYFAGDLSGITVSKIPFWFQHFYKPGHEISEETDWQKKLDEIVAAAPEWDIWVISGVPAWNQILLERIIKHYNVPNIHAIWPNLKIYCHGGVSLEPYRVGFEKLLGKPIIYLETYLASEGFVAYDARPNNTGMKLVLNNGIFYEFVPFNEQNFSPEGNLLPGAKAVSLSDAEERVPYALLLSTCAGAWRYLIGDVIQFTSKAHSEIKILGRTKHYISLCGEHLSVENMNQAIRNVSEKLGISIPEFAVAGEPHGSLFAHRWYIATDDHADASHLASLIDEELKVLNDDYKVERLAALKDVFVEIYPVQTFLDWMGAQGKMGGQNKFPRVLTGGKLESWLSFLSEKAG